MSDLMTLYCYIMDTKEAIVGEDEIAIAERKSLTTLAKTIAREIEEVYA